MIELRPAGVTTEIKSQPRILLPGYWVKFSDKFPDYLSHVKGKAFQIDRQVQVTYELSWIIREACYKDINLSNEDTGQKLFPDVADNLYEMLIGFKPGNYYIIPYFPADQPIYRLDYPTQTPLVSDSALKYLGTIKPADSPVENPTFKLYLVYELKPVILRIVADDACDYTKITWEILINRCHMVEGKVPENVTPKPIEYLDNLKW
jgi:hypothetical protein